MKRHVFFLFLLIFTLQNSATINAETGKNLYIMSYNIRNAKGLDTVTDYQRIANVIIKESPDIVAIQELDSVTKRSKGSFVLREIADRALMHYVYGASINYDGGKYGIGVMSKEKPLRYYSVILPGREEQRQLLVVEFEKYVFGCTHLSLTEEDRMLSIPIISHEAAKFNKPFFLAGDFNSKPESSFIKDIQNDFTLINDTKRFTFPANDPKECIDYITYYKGPEQSEKSFTVISSKVVNENVASDHRPIIANIRFKSPQDSIFRTQPYLQNPVNGGITIMWQTNVPVYGWVEYGTDTLKLKKAHTLQDGQVVCNNTNQKIRLSGLQPEQKYYYRVCSREIMLYRSYSKKFGETAISPFHSFTIPKSKTTDFTALIFNDLHKNQNTYNALFKQVENIPYDFTIFNGDCINDPINEDQALQYLSLYCKKVDAADKPMFFLRGNHEIRDAYSISLRELFDYVGGKTYGAFNWGDTRFVMYDCGEDKPDTTAVYYGLNDFTQLRKEQQTFLKEEIAGKEFKNSSKRILIGHIPIYGYNNKYRPCTDMWSNILAKAPFDVIISGHTHKFTYYPKYKADNNPFPVVIGGAPEIDKATVMILQKKGKTLTIKVLNTKGEILLDKEL